MIESTEIRQVGGMPVGVVRFREPMEVLSCAVLNGGRSVTSALFIMRVSRDYDNDDPASHAASVRDVLGLPEDSVGMMTAAEVDRVFNVAVGEYNGISVEAVATAGLSNQVMAGDVLDNYPERRVVSDRRASRLAGTINIAVISPEPLTEEGRVNMFIPLVEAKSAAMADRGYRETGTTSDAMAVISPVGGSRVSYTGTGSDIGIAAARAVRTAVGRALEIRGEHPVLEEPFRILSNLGYDASRLLGMSGSDMPEDSFRISLSEALSEPGIRSALDLALFAADRADSMAADGCTGVRDSLADALGAAFGFRPDLSAGTTEGALTALSRYVVIER